MKKMKCTLDKDAFVPIRAHRDDAGLDLRTPIDVTVPKGGSVAIDTGFHCAIPKGYFGKLESKSGLNVKHGVVSLGGTIDCGYTGSIVAKLYNFGDEDYHFKAGDKIVQMILIPYIAPAIRFVDKLDDTDRGSGGFGSSGR